MPEFNYLKDFKSLIGGNSIFKVITFSFGIILIISSIIFYIDQIRKIQLTSTDFVYIFLGLLSAGILFVLIAFLFQKEDIQVRKQVHDEEREEKELKNNEERLLFLVKEYDGKHDRKGLRELFLEQYQRSFDDTVLQNLMTTQSKYIGTIRSKNNYGPLLEEKDKKIKLTKEGKLYVGN